MVGVSKSQSSYANVRSLTKNTKYAKEQAAKKKAAVPTKAGSKNKPTIATPQTQNTSSNAPNFSSISGQQIYVPPNQTTVSSAQNSTPLNANTSTINGTVYTPAPTASTPPQAMPTNKPMGRISAVTNQTKLQPTRFAERAMQLQNEIVGGIKASFSGPTDGRDPASMSTAHQLGTLAGVLGQIASMNTLTGLQPATKVSQAVRVGVTPGWGGSTITTAGKIVPNTKTGLLTTNLLSKQAKIAGVSIGAAVLLKEVIGTYPYAGFLQEEALQTIGYGVSTASKNGDLEGAQAAIDLQREMLNPNLWNQIQASIPWVNVMQSLRQFREAAALKLEIDQKMVDTMKQKVETGETDDQMWSRLRQEQDTRREQQRTDDDEYYKQIELRRAEAKQQERWNDEAYYNNIAKQKEKALKERREEEQAYWAAVYRRIDEVRTINTPSKKNDELSYSKLNFGLLK